MNFVRIFLVLSISVAVLFGCDSGPTEGSLPGECSDGADNDSDCNDSSGGSDSPVGMVHVSAGAFWMGCNEEIDEHCSAHEKPYHEVILDSYYIDIFEVTAANYRSCVYDDVCDYSGPTSNDSASGTLRTYRNQREDHPINYVTWAEAKTYCEWVGKRLPTEAEWAKAARGVDGGKYPLG